MKLDNGVELDQRLWELYVNECLQTKTKPTIKDFTVWLQENEYAA